MRPRFSWVLVNGVVIHSAREVEQLRRAGRVAAATLAAIAPRLRAGITTLEIDHWVREDTAARGASPSQLGYKPRGHVGPAFPAAVCTSRNGVVCHGVPSASERLEAGDIINVDITSELDGFHGDTSDTFAIGSISRDAQLVIDIAHRALAAGIAAVRDGARLGDIGAAIEELARAHGCGIVREFGGHGIGRAMHMEPHVSHVGARGRGLRMRAGMTFTIEPMITIGWPELIFGTDGWTVMTADGSPSAQAEHTVLVTERGAEILTPLSSPDPTRATPASPG